MDHETAVRDSIAEKYFLHELDGLESDAFEAHYFACAECASQVRHIAALVASSKVIFEFSKNSVKRSSLPMH